MKYPDFHYDIHVRHTNDKWRIFDIIRKKYIVLTPEEWVRQHVVHFLINEKNYPKSLISIEKQVKVGKLNKRFDVVIYNNVDARPLMIIECKSYSIKLLQKSIDQVAQYNMELKAPWLIVTNWNEWLVSKLDIRKGTFEFLQEVPFYKDL